MEKSTYIITALLLVTILIAVFFVYKLLGNPYLRFKLIGTSHIEQNPYFDDLPQKDKNTYFLVKKYKYTRFKPNFMTGKNNIKDYYRLGVVDESENVIISPKYHYIDVSYMNTGHHSLSSEKYIRCFRYEDDLYEKAEYYKIENNKAIRVTAVKGK